MLSLSIPLGRYDNPDKQTQEDFLIDLYNNNLAVFGSSMSGKTVLLKTLILHMHRVLNLTEKEEIYILDFDNALRIYDSMPYVNGYFNGSNDESIRRVFKILDEKLSENSKKLIGSIYSEITNESKRPPHITFILDGYSRFISEDRYYNYHEALKKIARDGLSKGVTVIVASSDTKGFSKIASYFKRKIAFDLPKDSYSELYSNKVSKPLSLPGRGIVNDEEGAYEFQAYLPWNVSDKTLTEENVLKILKRKTILNGLIYDESILNSDESDEEFFKDFPESVNKKIYEILKVKKIKILPEENLTKDNLSKYCSSSVVSLSGKFVAGLDYYSLEPQPSVNLKELQTVAIYGKKEFGKSNLLKLIIEEASSIPDVKFCFWEDKRNSLTKPAGLNKTIESLTNKEFVYNKDQFMTYLQKNKFLNAKQVMNDSKESNLYIEKKSKVLSDYDKMYEEWFETTETEYRNNRAKIITFGTDEEFKKIEDERRRAIEQKKLEFENMKNIAAEINNEEQLEVNISIEPKEMYSEQKDFSQENFTVFVIQSRLFYQEYDEFKSENIADLISSIVENNVSTVLFIFSDVQIINNRKFQVEFNNMIKHAFLLDDIVRFISNKGQNSVFGNQDKNELKESFGLCDIGDGFYFDIDGDYITKLKFIHSFPNTFLEEGSDD